MSMTIKTTMMWTRQPDSASQDTVDQQRSAWLIDARDRGITDGIVIADPDTGVGEVITRYWIDRDSAESWSRFITQLITQHGGDVSVTISYI